MRKSLQLAGTTAVLLMAGSLSAFAACNGDTGTETVLGAASGAAVGGLASHSVAGAAIGGVAGGLIGNAIGQSNNREDCRREAQYYDQQGQSYYQGQGAYDRGYYDQQTYQQQEYDRQRQDYERQRQAYEQQRQAYDNRYYSQAPDYYGDRYRGRYDNNGYSEQTYNRSRYSDYPDGD
jgi:hypothetical protein